MLRLCQGLNRTQAITGGFMWLYNSPFLEHRSIYNKNRGSCKFMCDGPSQTTSLHAELASDRMALSILDTLDLPKENIKQFSIEIYNNTFLQLFTISWHSYVLQANWKSEFSCRKKWKCGKKKRRLSVLPYWKAVSSLSWYNYGSSYAKLARMMTAASYLPNRTTITHLPNYVFNLLLSAGCQTYLIFHIQHGGAHCYSVYKIIWKSTKVKYKIKMVPRWIRNALIPLQQIGAILNL